MRFSLCFQDAASIFLLWFFFGAMGPEEKLDQTVLAAGSPGTREQGHQSETWPNSSAAPTALAASTAIGNTFTVAHIKSC